MRCRGFMTRIDHVHLPSPLVVRVARLQGLEVFENGGDMDRAGAAMKGFMLERICSCSPVSHDGEGDEGGGRVGARRVLDAAVTQVWGVASCLMGLEARRLVMAMVHPCDDGRAASGSTRPSVRCGFHFMLRCVKQGDV